MKLNVTIEPANINGYVNLSPLKGDNIASPTVENNSCTDIILEVVNYLPAIQVSSIVTSYISKLRHGGKIIIVGTQIEVLLQHYQRGDLDMQSLNTAVFGGNKHTWDTKRNLNNIAFYKTLLEQLGLKVSKQLLDGDQFIIEGMRP